MLLDGPGVDGGGVVRLGAGTQEVEVPNFQTKTVNGSLQQNKNKVVNYIWHTCPIFRFATQTYNGGYKKKNEDRYKINVTYARFEYMANR